MKKLIFSLFLMMFLISIVSAFQLNQQLVQLEVDQNYPCHIENGNEIVCPSLSNMEIDEWKSKIQSTPATIDDGTGKQITNPEKNIGKFRDTEKVGMLLTNSVPYENKGYSKTIDLTKEYREIINPLSLDSGELIKIGFATNVFGVSGTPLENFDVNSTTGMVRYRPLNMTWLYFNTQNQFINTSGRYHYDGNFSFSYWFYKSNLTSSTLLLLTGQDGYGMNYILDDTFTVRWKNNTNSDNILTYNISSYLNNWHNLAYTWNQSNTNLSLYIDGIIINTSKSFGPGKLTTNFLILMGDNSGLSYSGMIDEFRIYNITLSAGEINSIYTNQRNRIKNVLSNSNDNLQILYLPFNENNGIFTTGINSIGNGTLYGMSSSIPSWQSDNINVTTLGYQVNISIVNITNALIFYDNYTLINQSETGNRTFSFLNNQSVYVLENYQLNEASPTTYSPIWFSSSTDTEKHIANNLSDSVNVSVIISSGIDCTDYKLEQVKYTTNGGIETSWTGSDALNICNQLKSTGVYLIVEPASSSNDLEFVYQCDSMTTTGFSLVMIFASLIIIIYLVYNIKLEGMTVGNMITIFITIIIALSLWLASGQNLGTAGCPF